MALLGIHPQDGPKPRAELSGTRIPLSCASPGAWSLLQEQSCPSQALRPVVQARLGAAGECGLGAWEAGLAAGEARKPGSARGAQAGRQRRPPLCPTVLVGLGKIPAHCRPPGRPMRNKSSSTDPED